MLDITVSSARPLSSILSLARFFLAGAAAAAAVAPLNTTATVAARDI
jgi:hypothetical protein